MKKDLSIKFYPHPTKVKDGKNQVFLRLIMDRKKAEIATDFFAAIDKWENFLKKDKTFDEEQSRLKREIYRIMNRLEDENKPASAKLIKDLLTNKQQVQVYLVDYFQSYINRISSLTQEYTKANVQKYERTQRYLSEFLNKRNRTKDILITLGRVDN